MAAIRAYVNRPVLFKWVIAAYVGLLIAFAYTQHTGHRADLAIRAKLRDVRPQRLDRGSIALDKGAVRRSARQCLEP